MAIPPIINLPKLSDGPQGSICAAFEKQLDVIIKALESAKTALNAPIEALRKMLDDIVGEALSAIGDIENTLNNMANSVANSIPVVEGGDQWLDMMKKCGLISEQINFENPSNAINKMMAMAIDSVGNAMFSELQLAESLIEMPIAMAINSINELIAKLKIPDIMTKMDELLQCIDAICYPADISDKVDYINYLLQTMYIDNSGFFLDQTLMTEVGISQAQKDIIIDIKADMLDIQDVATNSARSNVESGMQMVSDLFSAPANVASKVKSFFT